MIPLRHKSKYMLAPALLAVMSGCGGGDSSSASSPWYSNGYVLVGITGYNAEGAVTISEECAWDSSRRERRCEIAANPVGLSGHSISRFSTDGRLAHYIDVWDGFRGDTVFEYESGRLVKKTTSAQQEGTTSYHINTYSWTGDQLLEAKYADSEGDVPSDEDFILRNIEWENGRLATETEYDDDGVWSVRRSFQYDTRGLLQRDVRVYNEHSSRYPGEQAESSRYGRDENGNISVIEYFGDDGGLDFRRVFVWEFTGDLVQNFSLTRGREGF